MKCKLTLAVMTALLTIGLSSTKSYADSVTVTFSAPNQTVVAGGMVSFFGTVTADPNNRAPVFLNEGSVSDTTALISPGDNSYADPSPFLSFPLSLDPGVSSFGELFTVTLPTYAPVGYIFSGHFIVAGGSDSSSTDTLTPAPPMPDVPDFTVTVVTAASPVPEPSSLMLMGTGCAGILAAFKRRACWSVL